MIVGKDDTHILDVRLNSNYNTLALILSDSYAMVSIYRVSSGKSSVPHYLYKKGGKEYEEILKDVMKLVNTTRVAP